MPADPVAAAALIRRLIQIDDERRQMQTGDGIRIQFDPSKVAPAGLAEDPEKLADYLLARLIVTKVRPATRAAIVVACKDAPPADRVALAIKLILASPEYQLE